MIIPINYIEKKPDSDKYRIVGKGVTVELLSRLIDDADWTLERICENYNLTPAEVFAAWAFYYDHKDEIDARLQQSEDTPTNPRRAALIARYEAKTGETFND